MRAFSWFEIILYLLPVLTLILVNRYLRPYLSDGRYIHLAVVDVIHPILWACLHFISLWTFSFSLLPYLLILFALGVFALITTQRQRGELAWGNMLRRLSNISFVVIFVLYYSLVIYRIITLIIT